MAKWIKATFPGVRYREHESRKHGVKFDQYFTIRYKLDGKDKEEGLGWQSEGWTAKKAFERLSEIKRNIKDGKGPQSLAEKRSIEKARKAAETIEAERQDREAVTFGTFFNDTYLPHAEADKKQRTAEREKGLYKIWIAPVIGDLPLKGVSPFHLEKIKRNMAAAELSMRSAEYALSIVRQVFNVARRLGAFDGENPTAKVKFPKPDNGRMRFFTHDEADALLEALRTVSADVHDMTLLSLHCGLRFGEITALTWQDVDTERGVLTIRDAKAGSRYAFLTEQAAAMLRTRKQGKPSDLIFTGRKGKLDRISLTFKYAVDGLKLNDGIDDPRLKVVFHTCRHSYASWLIEEGADLYTVQKLLGHKTNVMTQRYAHLSENRLRGAAATLGKALSKGARRRHLLRFFKSRADSITGRKVVNFQK